MVAMKTKLQKVISSCVTLAQLRSALNYVTNYGISNGCDGVFYDAMILLRDRLQYLSGAHVRNLIDYKEYASLMISNGMIDEAKSFIEFAEFELEKLENFIK